MYTIVTGPSPERSNDQLLSAAMSSTTASGLFRESMMPSSRDMPSRPYFRQFRYDGGYARQPAVAPLPVAIPIRLPRGLPGSTDVICGIGATAGRVHPQQT